MVSASPARWGEALVDLRAAAGVYLESRSVNRSSGGVAAGNPVEAASSRTRAGGAARRFVVEAAPWRYPR
jgi:hypothetical protein